MHTLFFHSAPASWDAEGLHRYMKDLKVKHGFLIYPGKEVYSLGEGMTALPAERILSSPRELTRL